MKIKAVINSKTSHYTYRSYGKKFEIIDELPAIGDEFDDDEVLAIEEVWLDPEFNRGEAYDYNYYEITTKRVDDDEEYEVSEIFAIKVVFDEYEYEEDEDDEDDEE